MGVDIPDIRTVVHYGPPADIEDYLQESGRAGRDNKPSKAVLYIYPGCLIGHVNKSMKMYSKLEGEQCRRREILKYFPSTSGYTPLDPIHSCCDLCALRCKCGSCCSGGDSELQCKDQVSPDNSYSCDEMIPIEREVSQEQRRALRDKLMELRTTDANYLYLSQDVSCGLPITVVDTIVANCHIIHSLEDLEEQCSAWHLSHKIMEIIDDILS